MKRGKRECPSESEGHEDTKKVMKGRGVDSAVDQCEDPEEGPSTQIGAQRTQRDPAHFDGRGPEPSYVSMKTDCSTGFKRSVHQSPDSSGPGPSCVSLNSDWSRREPPVFKGRGPSAGQTVKQQSSEVLRVPSAQQHQRRLNHMLTNFKENMVTFVQDELEMILKVLLTNDAEYLESQSEDEEQRNLKPD